MKSKLISLCAVSASLIAICLTIGAYIEMVDLFAVVMASMFVLLPLYYNSFKGALLTFLAGGVIAILLSAFNFALVFPAYFGFLGIYPIVKHKMLQKNFNKTLSLILGLIWALLAFYGCYFYYTLVLNGVLTGMPDWVSKYLIYFVGLLAVVFFFVYDRFVVVMKFTIDRYLRRIVK